MPYSKNLVMTVSAALGILAALAVAPIAFAHDGDHSGVLAVEVGLEASVDASAAVGNSNAGARANATGSANMNATSSSRSNAGGNAAAAATGTTMRLDNRSGVAAYVQSLLAVADRDGGIGEEVRIVAREYASSSDRVIEAKAEVEGRPGWLTFIIGTDYGNLGKLRSELATTQNHIARLENAMNRSTDATVQAELAAQIDALETQASTTAKFVVENESKFSVLGWFFRIFQ